MSTNKDNAHQEKCTNIECPQKFSFLIDKKISVIFFALVHLTFQNLLVVRTLSLKILFAQLDQIRCHITLSWEYSVFAIACQKCRIRVRSC